MCPACLIADYQSCYEPKWLNDEEFIPCGLADLSVQQGVYIPQRKEKEIEDLKNPARVGRQRANRIKPIEMGDICEWAKLKYAGGGIEPIIGCMGSPARTLHHGPDKDWFNNDLSNLHKLCTNCHALYHSRNDKYYVDTRPSPGTPFYFKPEFLDKVVPHDAATKATIKEIMTNIVLVQGVK